MAYDNAQKRNPFRYLRPVPPDEFLGRWSSVKEIAWDLTLHDGDSYACIGGRRFGKSSLLIALHHYLRTPETREGDHIVLPLLLDFKRHNFQSETAFFAILLHEVRRRVDAGSRGRPKDPSPVKVPLDQNWLDALLTGDPPSLTLSRFEEALRYILDELYQSDGPTRLVLLLDEVDDTLRYPWHQVLFGHLRSLIYAGDLADSVRLVLAGSRRFLDEVTEQGSPLWNVLKLHYLTAFDEATTHELMERAPGLGEAAQRAVWQQSGGHPFLAQYLLHHLWKAGIDQADEKKVAQIANRFLHEEQTHLECWATAIAEMGLQVYGQLVHQQDWVSEIGLIRSVDDQNISVKRAVVDLCYHGFVVHDGNWNRYRYNGDIFREWFLSQYQGQQKREEPGDFTEEQQEQSEFRYDAFISYSHEDSPWVRNVLLPHLEGEGLRVCIDFRDFELGAPSLVNMENAVDRSRKTLLVLTPNWVASEWTEFEALLIQTRDPAGRGRRILPLMVQRCELPARLAVFTYLDLTNPAEVDFQMRRLVAAVRSALQPPAPAKAAPAPRPAPPARPRVQGFSHERGLAALGDLLAHADVQIRLDLAVLQSRLLDNLQHERLYGTSETIRSERARIVHELNRLALTHLNRSFNDLCRIIEETHAVIRAEPESAHPLPASQPVSSKATDLRLLVADSSGEQSASRLEFSIPPANSSRRPAPAWQVAFRLYLDNQRPTMARYVIVELCMTSNTDSFWLYRYEDAPFLIEEGPRPWRITPSDTHIHCYFDGGADFVCHDEVRQNLGLVKMLVPYGQADTTLTFQYRILAEGHKSQGSFAIALKPER